MDLDNILQGGRPKRTFVEVITYCGIALTVGGHLLLLGCFPPLGSLLITGRARTLGRSITLGRGRLLMTKESIGNLFPLSLRQKIGDGFH